MSQVVAKVRRFLERYRLTGTPGVVAVSGGPDSVALLRSLREAGAGRLTVAHVNHKLRGDESDADEAFVRGLGFDCRVRRSDVKALAARRNKNLEETARAVRYDWFEKSAAKVGAKWVATGHTADDQAETVLHRLIRGTGLRGLRGVAPVRGAGTVPVVRPLLTVTRTEVIDYLTSLAQPYRTDSTNADLHFTRNRIRHELMPLLTTFNPEVVSVLGRFAEQAEEAHAVIQKLAADLLKAAERPRAGAVVVLAADVLAVAPPYIAREAIRAVWERERWPAKGMTAGHWRRLAALVAGDYPGGVSLRRAGRVVQLGRRS